MRIPQMQHNFNRLGQQNGNSSPGPQQQRHGGMDGSVKQQQEDKAAAANFENAKATQSLSQQVFMMSARLNQMANDIKEIKAMLAGDGSVRPQDMEAIRKAMQQALGQAQRF